MKIILPIYYTQEFARKKNKTFLVGMNWYRNAHFHLLNQVKRHYHSLTKEQLDSTNLIAIRGQYRLLIELYYKNLGSDGSNICSVMEKFVLDAFKGVVVVDDKIKYHLGTTWKVVEKDKENPRVEITIEEVK